MKIIIYAGVILSLSACSTDNEYNSATTETVTLKSSTISIGEAANPENPYDDVGSNYLMLLDAYNAIEDKPVGNIEIKESLETLANSLNLLGSSYSDIPLQQILAVQQLGTLNPAQALSGLDLSQDGRQHISSMINTLTALKAADADFEALYAEMVGLEKAVLNGGLSPNEEQAVLSTFSVLRYEAYDKSRRKRRDRDWELSVGNIMATAYGATESIPNAIVSGAVVTYLN